MCTRHFSKHLESITEQDRQRPLPSWSFQASKGDNAYIQRLGYPAFWKIRIEQGKAIHSKEQFVVINGVVRVCLIEIVILHRNLQVEGS